MGVRTAEGAADILYTAPGREPSVRATLLLGLLVFVALVANGRPIGSGDTRSTEHVAVSLVSERNLDLDEFPAVTDPFAKTVGSHRVSVYPVLPAIVATPVFLAVTPFFALDEIGSQLAGKWSAALLSAMAAALLYRAVSRRHSERAGRIAALVFALGTSVFSTSQALWQHPAVVLFLSLALLFIARGENDERWIARAALPLALAAASRYAVAPMVAVVAVGLAARYPRRILGLVAWGAAPVLFVAWYQYTYFGSPWSNAFSGSASRFSEPWGHGHLALLFSPAKGLFAFTPVAVLAVVGLIRAFRAGERWLAGTLGAAILVHLLVVGRWSEWHGGESFGPRLLTDALPLLFLFVPEGREVAKGLFAVLAGASVAVQLLGAFAYDYRWERLFQRAAPNDRSWVWNVSESPILFHAREHVLIAALPAVLDGRAFVRERRFVPGAPLGSRVIFEPGQVIVTGSENTFTTVHLQRGARIEGGHAALEGRWDGIFFRALPATAKRSLEVRVAGRGRGTIYVGTWSFWGNPPRYAAYPIRGEFLVRHPYEYANGDDVLVTLGKAEGDADVTSVALVPRTEDPNTIVIDGRVIR